MNGATEDVTRSLRRFVAQALSLAPTVSGGPYRVAIEESVIRDEERPRATVVEATSVTTIGARRVTSDQGPFIRVATWAVMVYPEVDGTPRETTNRASDVAQRILDAIDIGLVSVTDPTSDSVLVSAPLQVPIFDFTSIPIENRDATAGPTEPYQWADVIAHDVQKIPDGQDDRRWTVAATIRPRWYVAGRDRPGGDAPPLAATIPGTFTP